ncbi:GNAT family N-acetyltransferase [Falsiroseomonas sp. CW058]|uniref:GNAT family N-acetyltransferase n=1 Tax=Falsiroseomonas sp. CW058 TaxID=3388664 RepID=UPI003D315B11
MRLRFPIRVARLAALPPGFEELAADATADGQRLLEVLRQDWESGAMRFAGPGEALFGAFAGDALLGLGGLTRDPYAKGEGAARLRRLYVRRSSRRQGVGRALVRAIVAEARAGGWARLRVRAPPAAFPFHESCGFLRAVGEASATHVMPLRPAAPGTP